MENFWEAYKHPKWQEKRLEVLSRAGFTCERCSETEQELHVHHKYYERGSKPWEYPDEAFLCVCNECHQDLTKEMSQLRMLLGMNWRSFGLIKALLMLIGVNSCVWPGCSMGSDIDSTTALAMVTGLKHDFAQDVLATWGWVSTNGIRNLTEASQNPDRMAEVVAAMKDHAQSKRPPSTSVRAIQETPAIAEHDSLMEKLKQASHDEAMQILRRLKEISQEVMAEKEEIWRKASEEMYKQLAHKKGGR